MFKAKSVMAVLLLCGVLLSGCGKSDTSLDYLDNLPANDVSYKTFTVERTDFSISSAGVLVPYFTDKTNYFCPFANATLVEIAVSRGDTVHTGDVLATFSFPNNSIAIQEKQLASEESLYQFNAQKDALNAQLAEKKAAVTDAESEKDRKVAKLQLEKFRFSYSRSIAQGESRLKSLQDEIAEMKQYTGTRALLASCDGIVSEVGTIFPGDAVSTSFKLLTTYTTDGFYYEAKNIGPLALPYDLPVTITFEERTGAAPITGRVVASAVGIDEKLDNTRTLIQPDTVPADLTWEPKLSGAALTFSDVLLLKETAVSTDEDSGLSFVYTLENDTLQKRYVICGPSADGMVCILDGLTEGQTVISN